MKSGSETVLVKVKRWMCNGTQECSKCFVQYACIDLYDLIEQRFLWQASEWVNFLSWESNWNRSSNHNKIKGVFSKFNLLF